MKNSEHYQRIKPDQDCDTLTTTTIQRLEPMLDKLKEAHVINDEAGRYNQA
jgi:hypothetical protein